MALPTSESRNDLKRLMALTKVAWIEHQGWIYRSDGTIEQIKAPRITPYDCTNPQPLLRPGSRVTPQYCVSASPAPTLLYDYTIGPSFANFWGDGSASWGLSTPVYGIGPITGPKYKPDPEPECSNPIPDAQEIASKIAEYITQNAATFSVAMVNAAEHAIDNWEGTGMGVAASVTFAMEFIGFVLAGLSFADVLIIFGVLALAVGTVYELWKCFHAS